jgi:hydroxymethylbilane synthase
MLDGDTLHLQALVGEPDGSKIIASDISGHRSEAQQLGEKLADELLSLGAKEILEKLYNEE